MSKRKEKSEESKASTIIEIIEVVQGKYLHLVFFAIAIIIALHLAGFEVVKEFPYVKIGSKGLDKPFAAGVMLFTGALAVWLWRGENTRKIDQESSSQALAPAEQLEKSVNQINKLGSIHIDEAISSSDRTKRVVSQRIVGTSLSDWVRLSKSKENWSHKVIHKLSSPDSDYSKYINGKDDLLKSEIDKCIDALEASFRIHEKPIATFKKSIGSHIVYREAIRILTEVMLDSLRESEELNFDSRTEKFLAQRIRDLEIREQ